MIHQLLNLTRPLFVIDTETTGLSPESSRIIELGFQKWESAGLTHEWRGLINPGIQIPPKATEITGITNEMVVHRPRFRQIAANLATGLSDCDFAGKNIRFDIEMLDWEFQRAEVVWTYEGARIIDIDRLEALIHPRNLAALHKKYFGVEHEDAHTALSDVRASIAIIFKQMESYPDILPRNLDELHTLQWPGWLTSCGKFRIVDGVPTIMFGKHRGTAIKDVPISYWDFILKPTSTFGKDVKQLAADAKLGRYPDVPQQPTKPVVDLGPNPELPGVRDSDGQTSQHADARTFLGLPELSGVQGNTGGRISDDAGR